MSAQDLQADKLKLISWISQLTDSALISRLKRIQEEESGEIPDWHKTEVRSRVSESDRDEYVSWDKARKNLRYKK